MLTKSDLSKIKQIVQDEIFPIKKDVKTLKDDVSVIRKDIKVIISFFDRELIDLRERVDRIEEFLKLPPLSL